MVKSQYSDNELRGTIDRQTGYSSYDNGDTDENVQCLAGLVSDLLQRWQWLFTSKLGRKEKGYQHANAM